MRIIWSPTRSDDMKINVVKNGDVLTINGEDFDFSFMNDGDVFPRVAIGSEWFQDDVRKVDGELEVKLLMPYGYGAPNYITFPEPSENVPDGEVVKPTDLWDGTYEN